MVTATYYTDPACPWSWAAEPTVRKLMLEFGESLEWSLVMSGLGRDWSEVVAAPRGSPKELVNGKVANGMKDVPSVLFVPVAVTRDNVQATVVADGFWTAGQICGGYEAACAAAQVQ